MADDRIAVPYNHHLKPLEAVLSRVRRSGDFFVEGVIEVPTPRIEVEGVGMLSFPLPEAQIQELIERATRAPYGRGEATILDESVRKVWQLPAAQVRTGGRAWEKVFPELLAHVQEGLGCAKVNVSAELYKMLVYDPGGFFKAHRDTEKTPGMFATLVVVLPSVHQGGGLVIRHAGREVVVDLSAGEFSDLKYTAFYADCEHEVRPVTGGHRVCLIYNLIQRPGAVSKKPLGAPVYRSEIAAAAKMLRAAFDAAQPPRKLAWLLEHQYSPEGLRFTALKGKDAARAGVLRSAAKQAGCAFHVGLVHIEERGPAEPHYSPRPWSRGRGRWRGYDEDATDEDTSTDDFEVVEVSESSRYVDQWADEQDRPAAYGALPLEEGEVLPGGALDDEKPDEQRLMESTGNEGASFERSYHRAALIIWPHSGFASVLLQAGVGAALPYLAKLMAARDPSALPVAERMIEAWEEPPRSCWYRQPVEEPSRRSMLSKLVRLGNLPLLERFINAVVVRDFDGTETKELAVALHRLGPRTFGESLGTLIRANMPLFPSGCVKILVQLLGRLGQPSNPDWRPAVARSAELMVEALRTIKPKSDAYVEVDWRRLQKAKPVDALLVADLIECLRTLDELRLRMNAAEYMAANSGVFTPDTVLVEALKLLRERTAETFVWDDAIRRLWIHAAEFLLARSEHPPARPTDWSQKVVLSCKCEDCCELRRFAIDPEAREARFRLRKDLRQHLHQQIERHGLDMTHITERVGSPQTLVCTKTRQKYLRQCEQHTSDRACMTELLAVMRPLPETLTELAARLEAARKRQPSR